MIQHELQAPSVEIFAEDNQMKECFNYDHDNIHQSSSAINHDNDTQYGSSSERNFENEANELLIYVKDLLARNEELQQLMQEQQIQYEREKCQHDFIETINAPYKHKKAIKKLIQRKYELESQNIKFKSLFSLIRNAKSKEEIDQVLNIKELQETNDTLKHDEKINTIPVPTISTPTTNTIVMPSKCSYSPKSSSTTATPSPRSSHFATSPSFSRTSTCPTTTNKFQHKKNIHDTSLPSSCVIQSPKHIETTASSNMITDLRNQLTKYKTKNQKLQEQVETWKNLVDMYEQMFGVVKVSSAELLEK